MVNALTGAAIGAGTKLIIDKITGKPVIKSGTGTTVPKAPAGGSKVPNAPAGGTKTPPAGGSKTPPAGGTKTPPAGGTKTPPAGGGSSTLPSATDIYKGTPADESLGLPSGSIDNGDGTYTSGGTTFDMQTGMPLYGENADGSISVVTDNNDGTYTIGNTTYSMENDSVLYTTDADGNITVAGGSTDTTIAGGDDSEVITGGGTRGLGSVTGDTTVAENEDDALTGDDTVLAGGDGTPEYYQDDEGNYYTMNADGGYDLEYYADGSAYVDESNDTAVADNTETEYFEDSLGNVYAQNEDGTYELYANADGSEVDDSTYYDDTLFADSTDYNDYSDYSDDTTYAYNDYDSYDYGGYDDGDYYGKRGGLITMMKKGGVPRFEDGGYSDTGEEVQDWQNVNYNYGEYDDPSLTGQDSLYSQSGDINNSYLNRSNPIAMASSVASDSSYVDNGDGTYSIGNFTYDMMTDEYMYSTDPDTGQITNVSPDYSYSTNPTEDYYDTDSLGNVFKNGEFYRAADVPEDATSITGNVRPNLNTSTAQKPITNVGSGDANTKKDVYQTDDQGNVFKNGVFYRAAEIPESPFGGLDSDFLSTLTNALGTTAGAAGAGALVASLLGSDFTGGGSGAQNQGVDMSQVGLINPRTTDFGIGPTNFVGYDQYGTDDGDYTPNEELLRNLNAPGYNPVREGDYGYEEVPTEETAEEPAMASGGLSSMSTPVSSYYTFGQPADIMANLGMRPQPPMNPPEMMPQVGQQKPPQQMQQQGLPQQMPPQMAQQAPQGMPQQGMMPQQQGMPPPMRKGGLPHVSNVPLTQGRMDFRKGAAVHGEGDGQSDDIPAMLADGEYVIDAETVAQIGNGSTKAGAQALDKFREGIRAHKRSAPINKIPPKTKALTSYLKGAK